MSQSSADFNLRYVLRALRRRLPIVVVCVLLIPAAAVVTSLLQKKQYTATGHLLFRDPEFDQKLFGNSFVQNQPDPTRTAATNLDLVELPQVAARTAARLHNVTQDEVSSAISVSADGQSDLVSIQATAASARFAATLANTYAERYIAFRRDADRATIQSAAAPLRRQIAALSKADQSGSLGQTLRGRLSQLGVLASLQTGGAELVQPAQVPTGPSSPKPVRNGLIGLFFGLVIGIALVAVAEALDRRLRDPGEVEQMFGRPMLAAVPETGTLATADAGLRNVPPQVQEAFRMLWVNLRYFSLSRDIRSVLVTSADRDDGKSTVAWGLSVAASSAGWRTLLIEADLRRGTLAARFDLRSRVGLTSVLAGDVPSEDAIMQLPLTGSDDDSDRLRSMDVLLAGPRPPDPSDLLQSHRMAEFVRAMEDEYDLVVIDTPPAAVVPDAVPLITLVRGVIVVSRLGNTVRDHLRRLRQQLSHLDAPVLGLVVNSATGRDPYADTYSLAYEDERPAAESRSGGGPGGRRVPRTVAEQRAAVAEDVSPDAAPAPNAAAAREPDSDGTAVARSANQA